MKRMSGWKIWAAAWWLCASGWAAGQGAPVAEYALKSALLFKLPHFVYLPEAGRGTVLDVCLLGSNPFGQAPERLARQPVEGRSVRWLALANANAADAQDCEFVFIARSETAVLDATLRRLAKWPVVTVSDIEGFALQGGMVELALAADGSSLQILINRKAAQKQGIEFNAQLLRLARVIEP